MKVTYSEWFVREITPQEMGDISEAPAAAGLMRSLKREAGTQSHPSSVCIPWSIVFSL